MGARYAHGTGKHLWELVAKERPQHYRDAVDIDYDSGRGWLASSHRPRAELQCLRHRAPSRHRHQQHNRVWIPPPSVDHRLRQFLRLLR